MVFTNDQKWLDEYTRRGIGKGNAARHVRFRSWGTEEMLVKCCMKYMPWLNAIHILLASESQEQQWMRPLDRYNGSTELRIAFHRDFIPAHLLPCFNVNTIEMFLHRIPRLSEYFIYSNDDLFPLSPLKAEDFFRPADDGTLWPCQHHFEQKYPESPKIYHLFVKNGLDMIAADFGRQFVRTWIVGGHSMAPMRRSVIEKVWELHADRINQSFTEGRKPENFNQYIFPFYQHFSGQYFDHHPPRRYVGPGVLTEQIAGILRDENAGIICLNDGKDVRDWERRAEIARREISAKLDAAT